MFRFVKDLVLGQHEAHQDDQALDGRQAVEFCTQKNERGLTKNTSRGSFKLEEDDDVSVVNSKPSYMEYSPPSTARFVDRKLRRKHEDFQNLGNDSRYSPRAAAVDMKARDRSSNLSITRDRREQTPRKEIEVSDEFDLTQEQALKLRNELMAAVGEDLYDALGDSYVSNERAAPVKAVFDLNSLSKDVEDSDNEDREFSMNPSSQRKRPFATEPEPSFFDMHSKRRNTNQYYSSTPYSVSSNGFTGRRNAINYGNGNTGKFKNFDTADEIEELDSPGYFGNSNYSVPKFDLKRESIERPTNSQTDTARKILKTLGTMSTPLEETRARRPPVWATPSLLTHCRSAKVSRLGQAPYLRTDEAPMPSTSLEVPPSISKSVYDPGRSISREAKKPKIEPSFSSINIAYDSARSRVNSKRSRNRVSGQDFERSKALDMPSENQISGVHSMPSYSETGHASRRNSFHTKNVSTFSYADKRSEKSFQEETGDFLKPMEAEVSISRPARRTFCFSMPDSFRPAADVSTTLNGISVTDSSFDFEKPFFHAPSVEKETDKEIEVLKAQTKPDLKTSDAFIALAKLPADMYKCSSCWLKNKKSARVCISCEEPNPHYASTMSVEDQASKKDDFESTGKGFSFGNSAQNSNPDDGIASSKPFSFGAKETTSETKTALPLFSFGDGEVKSGATFSFGATEATDDKNIKDGSFPFSAPTKIDEKKDAPSFSFGQSSDSVETKPKKVLNAEAELDGKPTPHIEKVSVFSVDNEETETTKAASGFSFGSSFPVKEFNEERSSKRQASDRKETSFFSVSGDSLTPAPDSNTNPEIGSEKESRSGLSTLGSESSTPFAFGFSAPKAESENQSDVKITAEASKKSSVDENKIASKGAFDFVTSSTANQESTVKPFSFGSSSGASANDITTNSAKSFSFGTQAKLESTSEKEKALSIDSDAHTPAGLIGEEAKLPKFDGNSKVSEPFSFGAGKTTSINAFQTGAGAAGSISLFGKPSQTLSSGGLATDTKAEQNVGTLMPQKPPTQAAVSAGFPNEKASDDPFTRGRNAAGGGAANNVSSIFTFGASSGSSSAGPSAAAESKSSGFTFTSSTGSSSMFQSSSGPNIPASASIPTSSTPFGAVSQASASSGQTFSAQANQSPPATSGFVFGGAKPAETTPSGGMFGFGSQGNASSTANTLSSSEPANSGAFGGVPKPANPFNQGFNQGPFAQTMNGGFDVNTQQSSTPNPFGQSTGGMVGFGQSGAVNTFGGPAIGGINPTPQFNSNPGGGNMFSLGANGGAKRLHARSGGRRGARPKSRR